MNRIRKLKVVLLIVIIAIGLAACKKKGDALSVINVAYFPNITHAQALIMKGQGRLEKKLDGISVKWIPFNAGPSEIEALFAGKIDIGYIGPVPAVSGYVQSDGDLKIIAGATNGGSVLVAREGANINSAADLAGKNVAVPQFGNTQHLSLLSLLTTNSLAPTSNRGTVNVIQCSNANIAGLMEQKQIDAALVPEPWGSILEIRHNATVVLDYDKIDVNGIPSTAVVIVRKDFLDSHKDIVEKFIEVHREVTVYINENDVKETINAEISEVTQSTIDDDILKSALGRLEITYHIPDSSIMDFAKISLKEGFISKLPTQEITYDNFVK
jgi:NitT/TauT family transport system substrate-binding protein